MDRRSEESHKYPQPESSGISRSRFGQDSSAGGTDRLTDHR